MTTAVETSSRTSNSKLPERRICNMVLSRRPTDQPDASFSVISDINFVTFFIHSGDEIIKKRDLCLLILIIFNLRAEPMVVKFLQQSRDWCLFHVMLEQGLDGSQPGGGTGGGFCSHFFNLF